MKLLLVLIALAGCTESRTVHPSDRGLISSPSGESPLIRLPLIVPGPEGDVASDWWHDHIRGSGLCLRNPGLRLCWDTVVSTWSPDGTVATIEEVEHGREGIAGIVALWWRGATIEQCDLQLEPLADARVVLRSVGHCLGLAEDEDGTNSIMSSSGWVLSDRDVEAVAYGAFWGD